MNWGKRKILSIYILLFFFVWSCYAYFLSPAVYSISPYYGTVIKLLVWTLPVCLIIVKLYKQNLLQYLKLYIQNRKLFFCVTGFILLLLTVWNVSFCLLLYKMTFNLNKELYMWINAVLLIGFTEEFVFRGFLLQELNKLTNFRNANLLQAILFTLIHFPGWLRNGNFFTPIILNSICFIFVFALVQGWTFRKTGTLWSCILIHMVNNFITIGFGM